MTSLVLALSFLVLSPLTQIQVGDHVFHRRTLANGLEALAVDDGEGGSLSVFVVYAVGNRAETAETTGLAHLTEHALFTGTKTTAAGEHDAAIKALKGESNAYTRDDFTAYYAHKIPAAELKAVLALEADRMRGLTWKEADFLHERERLRVEEVHGTQSDLQLGARREFAVWAGRGYGTGLSDAKGNTKGPTLSLEQSRAFYDRWYRPRNAAVVIVGADPQGALDAVEAAFGGLPAGPRPPVLGDVPGLRLGEHALDAPLSRPRREWVWVGPSLGEFEDRLALTLIAELCDKRTTADGSSVDVWQGGRIGADLFVIASTGPEALEGVGSAFEAIAQNAWTEAELAKAKGNLRDAFTSTPLRARPYFSLAVEVATLTAYGFADFAGEFPARVDALTREDLNRVAQRWLTPERRLALSFQPTGENLPLPTDVEGLRKAAEEASASGELERAIEAYTKLIELGPGRVNLVIYRYSLGSLNRQLGRLEEAKKQLLAGLKVIEYPALRELLEKVEQDIAGKGGAETPSEPTSKPTKKPARKPVEKAAAPQSSKKVVGTKGEVPPEWAASGSKVMGQLERWRGLPFAKDLVVEFLEEDPEGPAGWYEPSTGRLVVTLKGSERFGRGTMLHEMFHALQDQHHDLTKVHERGTTDDSQRAITALIEGEAMLAVQELMDYDFSRHTKIPAEGDLDTERFKKIFHYGGGLDFAYAIRRARGWKGMDDVFAKPPRSTAEIFHPERYLAGWKPLPASEFPKAPALNEGETLESSGADGEYGVRLFLARHPSSRAQAAEFGTALLGDVHHQIRAGKYVLHTWHLRFEGDKNLAFLRVGDMSLRQLMVFPEKGGPSTEDFPCKATDDDVTLRWISEAHEPEADEPEADEDED